MNINAKHTPTPAVLPRRPDSTRGVGEHGEHLGSGGETRSTHPAPLESGRSIRTALPVDRPAAARALQRIAELNRRSLRTLPKDDFLQGWHALLFLFPGLHPDNALDHGDATTEEPTGQLGLPGFEKLLERRNVRSGWPVALELIGQEAWRRFEAKELAGDEFYSVDAQRAGLTARDAEVVA